MLIGKFGSMTFEVSSKRIRTFHDFSLSGELETESGDAVKKKKTITIKGIGPVKISLELSLQTVLGCDVRNEIDEWLALKDTAATYPFILCGRAVSLNQFLLTNCDVSNVEITPVGSRPVITAAALKLQFSEYIPPDARSTITKKVKSAKGKKSSSKSAKGVSTETIQISNPYKVPTSAQKAAAKR